MYASFRGLVADALDVSAAAVQVEAVGADETLIDSGAGSNRVTAVVGSAVLDAASSCSTRSGHLTRPTR